mmetsp:Transcript_22639/g.37192  ORF Transcript_22639/g.37192 Transcript_22639/m.37192 type:complete len:340 (-) Transcript_22639:87-1106(-)
MGGAVMRRPAVFCVGVGAAAGSMGTYFEMSHGVVCIPVMTLPPLALTNQVAVGSTVVGVAARELLALGLYCLDPDVEIGSEDHMNELSSLVDMQALLGLASVGTVTAIAGASLAGRGTNRLMRRTNGIFCIGLALFIQWREGQRFKAREALEELEKAANADAPPSVQAASEPDEFEDESISSPAPSPAPLPVQRTYTPYEEDTSWQERARLGVLGAASGFILGYFGIGTAWLLAPTLRHTSLSGEDKSNDAALDFGADDRTRRTAALAMVVPSVASAVRHFQLGQVASVTGVALPLAAGAIAGSAIGGKLLEDVPREGEEKLALAMMLFAYGTWSFFKP